MGEVKERMTGREDKRYGEGIANVMEEERGIVMGRKRGRVIRVTREYSNGVCMDGGKDMGGERKYASCV